MDDDWHVDLYSETDGYKREARKGSEESPPSQPI